MKKYTKEELKEYSEMYVTLSEILDPMASDGHVFPQTKKIKLSELCSLITQLNAYNHEVYGRTIL